MAFLTDIANNLSTLFRQGQPTPVPTPAPTPPQQTPYQHAPLQGMNNLPIFDDQGRLLAINGQYLPRPADLTDQSFALHQAFLNQFQPVRQAAANNADEAFNHQMLVYPFPYASPSAQQRQNDANDNQIHHALTNFFMGRK